MNEEEIDLIQGFITILETIPFERRSYEQERWREYWIRHYRELSKNELK